MEQAIERQKIFPVEAEAASAAAEDGEDFLVKAILAGDDAAFAVLFERYRRLVAHLVSRFFYRREEVEDLIQQSFTKIYFSLKDFRGTREKSFPAWLSKITINVCLDELRRLKRRPESRVGDLSDEEILILENAAQIEAESAETSLIKRDLAEKLLANLETSDRLALTLFYGEDCSIEEVARLVGWSPNNVKTRLFRARNYLRKVLRRF